MDIERSIAILLRRGWRAATGDALLFAAVWWVTRHAWAVGQPVDDGRPGGPLGPWPAMTLERDEMWTITLVGTVVVFLLAMALRPPAGDGRRVWATCLGVVQVIGNFRSPAWGVLVGFWSALLVDHLGGSVVDQRLQADDGVEREVE